MSDIKTVKEFLEEKDKEKCKCGAKAVWWYAPGYIGKKAEDSYYCEEHVPRGCSCEWNYVSEFGPPPEDKRWKWITQPADENNEEIKEGEVWAHIDEQGREYPCCEFWYQEKGWDKN